MKTFSSDPELRSVSSRRMLGPNSHVSSLSACQARLCGQVPLRHGTRAVPGTKPVVDHPRLQMICRATKGKFSSFDDMLGVL